MAIFRDDIWQYLNDSMTGSISMRHSDRAANDIHEGGIVQSAPLSLQHTAVHNNYNIQIFKNTFHQYCTRQYLNNYDIERFY